MILIYSHLTPAEPIKSAPSPLGFVRPELHHPSLQIYLVGARKPGPKDAAADDDDDDRVALFCYHIEPPSRPLSGEKRLDSGSESGLHPRADRAIRTNGSR